MEGVSGNERERDLRVSGTVNDGNNRIVSGLPEETSLFALAVLLGVVILLLLLRYFESRIHPLHKEEEFTRV